ncbi:MAG TPA: aldo/keto reductase [Acidimicrobiia bacterium]|nr:aldo/keto reductase [Acidimicrobiia bacterium]
MEHRQLGRSGLRVSLAGLGCNNFGMRIDQEATNAVVHAALDAGITLFDTARIYGGGKSEGMLGAALGTHRADVLVATKFGLGTGPDDAGGSRRHVIRSVETSLRELGTDWIDLFQLHFPDPTTPIEETLCALSDLVRSGKVRYVGCSNFTGWMIADAHWTAQVTRLEHFVSAQNEWSLLHRGIEAEVVGACERYGLGIIPYFPLASGLLTGKVRRGEAPPSSSRLSASHFARVLTDANFDKLEALETWGAEHGRGLLEVALSWLGSHPAVGSVIAGATSPEQVHANARATRGDLTPAERAEIGELVGLTT